MSVITDSRGDNINIKIKGGIMAEALGGYYPGGAANPHVNLVTFEGGYYIEPKPKEVAQATFFHAEAVVPADDRLPEPKPDDGTQCEVVSARVIKVAQECGPPAVATSDVIFSTEDIFMGRMAV